MFYEEVLVYLEGHALHLHKTVSIYLAQVQVLMPRELHDHHQSKRYDDERDHRQSERSHQTGKLLALVTWIHELNVVTRSAKGR